MGLIDAFSADARVEFKVGDLYDILRVSASNEKTAQFLKNAVKCEVPYRYIREVITGEKETETDGGIHIEIPSEILNVAFEEAKAAAREMMKKADLEKEGASGNVSTESEAAADGDPLSDCAPENASCEECPNKDFCEERAEDIAGMVDEQSEESEGGEE